MPLPAKTTDGARRRVSRGERKAVPGRPGERLDAFQVALENLPQAICMFDAQSRLVLCNPLYAKLLGLPIELSRPGTPVAAILDHAVAVGMYPGGDSEAFLLQRIAIIDNAALHESILEIADGRVFFVVHLPLPNGGFLISQEDITRQAGIDREMATMQASLIEARRQAERAAEEAQKAHRRLLDAFEVVPEALTVMDSQNRFVLWNRRYEDLIPDELRPQVGMDYETWVREAVAKGMFPDAVGREQEWIADRLAKLAAPDSRLELEIAGGRWVRVEDRRTSEGGSIGLRLDVTEWKQRQNSFQLLFDGNPLPMWVFDQETLRFLAVNDAMVQHYGYTREQFLAMTILDLRPEEDWPAVIDCVATTEGDENGDTWRHVKADGTEIQASIYARSIAYEGHKGRLVAVIDVTERMRVKSELLRTEAFLNLVIESIPDAIIVKDVRTRRYTMINPAAEALIGMSRADILGKTADAIYPEGDYLELVKNEDEELLRKGALFIDDHTLQLRGKEPRIVTLNRKLLRDEKGEPQFMLAVIHDVTARRRAEERIAHLARHDPLTDLPNRAMYDERLAAALSDARTTGSGFAVLGVDLDRLKEVNDVFGHAAGDELLREVACRLLGAAGSCFLARLGGDEFGIITNSELSRSEVADLADRLLQHVAEEMEIQGVHIQASLSIGVALYPEDGVDAKTLLGNADAALYRAKAEGRGVTRFFKTEMDKRLRERHALRHDLSVAIERGELSTCYQPQCRVTGEVVSFEALLRWRHPVRGNVSPGEFIPIAEESRLIVTIGEWVLRDACREAASWAAPLGVAINLSPVQFQHGDLPSLVHSVLLETGLTAHRLELEITEGVLLDDSSRGLSILRRLKALGVRIAMDDFGKGYSSLSYLQSFPFDKIKIDRAFVSNVTRNPQSAAIVRAVMGLARGLGLPVLAEGVETKEELDFLAAEACDLVQGYLLGRPFPISAYAEIVNQSPPPRLQLAQV